MQRTLPPTIAATGKLLKRLTNVFQSFELNLLLHSSQNPYILVIF